MATLLFAGLRIGEALDLDWDSVDLAEGRLRVRKSKTDAGLREVHLLPVLRDELVTLKSARSPAPSALVFPTATGRPQSASNVRGRVLRPASIKANTRLRSAGLSSLPRLTNHALRRTFASVLYALGHSPVDVMSEMGHTDPGLALRIYARSMTRDDDALRRLKSLVNGEELGLDQLASATQLPPQSRPSHHWSLRTRESATRSGSS